MKQLTRRALIGGVAMLPFSSLAQTPAPPEALLYIIWPRDGQKVRSPFGSASVCAMWASRGRVTGRRMSATTIC
jgi:hypothetical protein